MLHRSRARPFGLLLDVGHRLHSAGRGKKGIVKKIIKAEDGLYQLAKLAHVRREYLLLETLVVRSV